MHVSYIVQVKKTRASSMAQTDRMSSRISSHAVEMIILLPAPVIIISFRDSLIRCDLRHVQTSLT
jgi:hypothetical protein